MSLSKFEILTGVGRLYAKPILEGDEAITFPLVDTAPDAEWLDLGETQDGVTVTIDQDVEELEVDQTTGPVKAVRTSEHLAFETKLVKFNLENLALVLGNTVSVHTPMPTNPGFNEVPLHRGPAVGEIALLFRGQSPYGAFNAQYQLPRAYFADSIEIEHVKDANATIPIKATALVDLNATDHEEFGTLVAQTAARAA